MTAPDDVYDSLHEEISTVLVGKDEIVEHLTIALLTRGHVLLEGPPGIAKTTTANLFARALGLDYSRIQMTPDLLPADIVGSQVYREHRGEFEIRKGPVFSHVVVADELNRTTAKTQSALLEAMAEGHVTIEGQTFALPDVFLVVATQTPIDFEGTYELPEVQRDRFAFKLRVQRPDRDEQKEILDRFDGNPQMDATDIDQVLTPTDIETAREAITEVYVDDRVKQYVLDIINATHDADSVSVGASTRATLTFQHAAKAKAAIHGREYILPDDVKDLAEPILNHRLVLDADAELSGMSSADVIDTILSDVPTPAVQLDAATTDQ